MGNNPIQSIDCLGLQFYGSGSIILECAEVPNMSFAECVCLAAPDSKECENSFGDCLNAIGSKFTDVGALCDCMCKNVDKYGLSKTVTCGDCKTACKSNKKVLKMFQDWLKKNKPPVNLPPISIPIPPLP